MVLGYNGEWKRLKEFFGGMDSHVVRFCFKVWFSEMDAGFQFTYKSDSNQMTFLQLLSTHSQQNLTYHCRNSVAHYDAAERSHKKALKILGWNDIELNASGKKRFKYEVTEDECKVSQPLD